jgi:hypothetical protein
VATDCTSRGCTDRAVCRAARSGQALVEFVVGMVGLLVLVAFVIQVGRIAMAHTEARIEARRQAAGLAMLETYTTPAPMPRFIRDWQEGRDGARYSVDDTALSEDPGRLSDGITGYARPEQLRVQLPGNAISTLDSSGYPMLHIGLVRGHDHADRVEWMPLLRRLLVDDRAIQMEAEVYMTWTKGLE